MPYLAVRVLGVLIAVNRGDLRKGRIAFDAGVKLKATKLPAEPD